MAKCFIVVLIAAVLRQSVFVLNLSYRIQLVQCGPSLLSSSLLKLAPEHGQKGRLAGENPKKYHIRTSVARNECGTQTKISYLLCEDK